MEKELMIRFRKSRDDGDESQDGKQQQDKTKNNTLDGKEKNSLEEDVQQEGTSPTDNFFNEEYRKMMEEGTALTTDNPPQL
jgi:hypothetical protein